MESQVSSLLEWQNGRQHSGSLKVSLLLSKSQAEGAHKARFDQWSTVCVLRSILGLCVTSGLQGAHRWLSRWWQPESCDSTLRRSTTHVALDRRARPVDQSVWSPVENLQSSHMVDPWRFRDGAVWCSSALRKR